MEHHIFSPCCKECEYLQGSLHNYTWHSGALSYRRMWFLDRGTRAEHRVSWHVPLSQQTVVTVHLLRSNPPGTDTHLHGIHHTVAVSEMGRPLFDYLISTIPSITVRDGYWEALSSKRLITVHLADMEQWKMMLATWWEGASFHMLMLLLPNTHQTILPHVMTVYQWKLNWASRQVPASAAWKDYNKFIPSALSSITKNCCTLISFLCFVVCYVALFIVYIHLLVLQSILLVYIYLHASFF